MPQLLTRFLTFLAPWRPGGLGWFHIRWVVIAAWLVTVTLSIGIGAGTTYLITHEQVSGGLKPGPVPPQTSLRGAPQPPRWTLGRFSVRLHNQGVSSSCVGQTLATIEEITQAERGRRWAFSSGFIYDLANHGSDNGATYQDAFAVLTAEGDPGLSVFPHDGQDWWAQPDAYQIGRAHPYHFASWRSISTSDQYTMEAEIRAGRPLAIGIRVTDSFYGLWGNYSSLPVVSGQFGAFHFYHSITGIGYTPTGVIIQNSWGPGWGHRGRAILSWAFIASESDGVIVSSPYPPPPPKPPLSPALAAVWAQYRHEHHLSAIAYKSHGRLTEAAKLWKARAHGRVAQASHIGGIVSERYFGPGKHRLAYTEDRFQGALLVWWNGRPHFTPKWTAATWLR